MNFLGMGGSLYNGTLGVQSSNSNHIDLEDTPLSSFRNRMVEERGKSRKASNKTSKNENGSSQDGFTLSGKSIL